MKTYLKPASGSFNGSSWSKLVFYGSKLSICCLVRSYDYLGPAWDVGPATNGLPHKQIKRCELY